MQNSSPRAMHLLPQHWLLDLAVSFVPQDDDGTRAGKQSEIHLFALIYGNDDEFEELNLVVAVL